jgi:hypothetical protein
MRNKLTASLVLLAAAAALATPAGAGLPPGKGLFVPPLTFTCEGVGQITILTPRPDRSANVWEITTGDHTVVKSFQAVFTLLPTGGGAPVDWGTETITYGAKTGLPTRTCTSSTEYPVDEGTAHVDLTLVFALLPTNP